MNGERVAAPVNVKDAGLDADLGVWFNNTE